MSRQARTAQTTLFFIFGSFGVMIGLWASAIPHLQKRLALSAEMLGMCIFCFGIGAVLATVIVPKYVERYQTRPVMILGGCAMWLVFPFALNAPSVAIFMILLVILGFFSGILDTSMNSHAFTVEHHLQKPTISLFHGGFSLGNALGSLLASLIISLSIQVNTAAIWVALCATLALFYSHRFCYAHDTFAAKDTVGVSLDKQRIPLPLIVVALLCGICFFAEGAIGDWSGLFLRDVKQANVTQTALTMAAFASGMTLARFLGDDLRARLATLPLLAASSALSALMMFAFLVAPTPNLALLALLGAGLGYANIVPLLFIRAAQINGISATRGVAFAAGMGYASLLGGPALLGYLAEQFGLAAAMVLIVLGSVVLAIEAFTQLRKKP